MEHDRHPCACCGANLGQLFGLDAGEGDNLVSLPLHAATRARGSKASTIALQRAVGAASQSLTPEAPLQPAPVRTRVFHGGPVMTVDASFSTAESIAIKGNRILAVGSKADVLAGAGAEAETIDLKGRALLPGFIDPHTHILVGSLMDQSMEYVGINRFRTRAEIIAHLKTLVARTPQGEWIVARNYYPMLQSGQEAFGLDLLDGVSTRHPVAVMNASGHILYANRAAFAAAGVPEDIADPPGGQFERGPHGDLTGVIKNQVAFFKVLGAFPGLAKADPVNSVIATCQRFSSLGLTTVTEHALGGLTRGRGDLGLLQQAAATGALTQRIRAYAIYTLDEAWDACGIQPNEGDAHVRLAGYKLIADGSNQGFTGLQREPYLGTEEYGLAYLDPEELTRLLRKRAEQGFQISIHGNGDKAIDNILDAVDAIQTDGIATSPLRIRIEHCSILHDEQIARMKTLGISASFLIAHVHFWGTAMRDAIFGPEKAALLDRCASCEAAGVGFTIHSDFFVTDPGPLHMIEMAVTRRTWTEPDFCLAPHERVSVETAIRAMTSEAAWQLGSEHEVGSLEPGKLADFVILESDPRTVAQDDIKSIKVCETWMDGERVFQA